MSKRTGSPAQARRDRLVMWTTIPLGVALFLTGLVGARTGAIALPFDEHHIWSQVLGLGLLLFGLTRWR
jgi:hydrogenase/urease accessory protein HupE